MRNRATTVPRKDCLPRRDKPSWWWPATHFQEQMLRVRIVTTPRWPVKVPRTFCAPRTFCPPQPLRPQFSLGSHPHPRGEFISRVSVSRTCPRCCPPGRFKVSEHTDVLALCRHTLSTRVIQTSLCAAINEFFFFVFCFWRVHSGFPEHSTKQPSPP